MLLLRLNYACKLRVHEHQITGKKTERLPFVEASDGRTRIVVFQRMGTLGRLD
jgi:hypothetical protein